MIELVDREHGRFTCDDSPNLIRLMLQTANFERSEPRDGVFGLLGMLKDIPDGLVPDYRKSVAVVYQETTRYLLRRWNNLAVLQNIQHPPGGPRDCSWAFSNDFGSDQSVITDGVLCHHDYQAHGGLEDPNLLASEGDDLNTILLQGIETDSILVVSTVCTIAIWRSYSLLSPWLLKVAEDLSLSHSRDPGGRISIMEEVIESLARTIVAGSGGTQSSGTKKATPEHVKGVAAWFKTILDHDLASSDAETYYTICKTARIRAHERASLSHLVNRRLFKTRDGKLGLGPQAMRPGDSITALRGSDLPVILRPCEQEFRFIGLSYVNGLMYGETVPALQAAGVEEHVFIVR
ncbi:hypothetical protein B0A48_15928 [Cryoendolithus antarcticus]|uniref:Heterokaryon incompatibility domain-containing protein n=1 Tax=Cryoendolithus antarcticus TaxID=1507870 RepID=A0A1V8SG36_9PEZI|nr:hypothetical protein B0A48_15928 [Cryoendolithus antarcticus]